MGAAKKRRAKSKCEAGCQCFECIQKREGVKFGPPSCEADAAIRTLKPYRGGGFQRHIGVCDGRVLFDVVLPVGQEVPASYWGES